MRLLINQQEVVLPSSLSEITLEQRIRFQEEQGNLLQEMHKSILEMEPGLEQELEFMTWNLEKVYRSLAFFLNMPVEAVKESEFIDDLFGYYVASIEQVFKDEEELIESLQSVHYWNDEKWVIASPELKQGHKMKFGEFIDSKQMIQDMIGLGKNRWECLVPLAAIFLRKEGEPYKEEFLYDDSERLQLMRTLPLDIALHVGFFLSSSLTLYSEAFQSSTRQG